MEPTQQIILREAEKVLSRKGLLRTSIHEIASACNLGVASLYHYYSNKEEILFAIVEKNLGEYLREMNAHLAGISDPIARLEKYVWFQFYSAQKYPENSRLVLLELRNREDLSRIPAYRYLKEIVNQLVPILKDGQKQGVFARNMDAITFRNLVWGTLEAFTRNWLIFKRPENILDYVPAVTERILLGVTSPSPDRAKREKMSKEKTGERKPASRRR